MNRQRWIRIAIVDGYVLSVTYMAGKWAMHYAYLERGYDAVGGEYLFILMVAWAAYEAINIFFNVLEESDYEEGECKETAGGGTAGMRDNQ